MNIAEYEKSGRALYVEFAGAIAAILRAALDKTEDLNVQFVAHRAKDVASLVKTLADRGLEHTETLEAEIKDLAGCRVVLYTNSDVARLGQSRLVHDNFDVLEVKVHEPGMSIANTNELYQSNHFVVALKQNRAELSEYSAFAGLRCEIQIQTILNHAWAQMAHDTIYKSPTLDGFGQKALQAVTARLSKVMTKYLLPAGYEFDKITADFERLANGKALFDEKALGAIGAATNNNDRADAIEVFIEQVMPLYDNLTAEYRDIVNTLVSAVEAARLTAPIPRTFDFGALPGITSDAITQSVATALIDYRYVDIGINFEALCDLYASAISEEERTSLDKVGAQLAKHDLHAWQAIGPGVQSELLDRIEALEPKFALAIGPLLAVMLKEVLGAEISGTTGNSSSVTFHSGVVILSEKLLEIRHRATAVLQTLFEAAKSENEQKAILAAMEEATRAPYRAYYGNDLAAENARAAASLLQFERDHIAAIPYFLLESLEHRALRFFRTYGSLPKAFKDDDTVAKASAAAVAEAEELRTVVNANDDFVVFKTLVGFETVLPPAWDDESFQWQESEEYRRAKVEDYIANISDENRDQWFDRIERYASTDSRDLATFPIFGHFLVRLGEIRPTIAIDYLGRMGPRLAGFAHHLVDGAMKSADPDATAFTKGWIATGTNLNIIVRYLIHADPFDPALLTSVCEKAIERGEADTLRLVVAAAERQFRRSKAEIVAATFEQALHFFYDRADLRWVDQFVPWLGSPVIEALDEDEARKMLDALVQYPEVENNAEYLVAGLAKNWPGAVLEFFGDRLAYGSLADQRNERNDENADGDRRLYQAFPFSIHQLRAPLRTKPSELIDAARQWYAQRPELFRYGGGHIIATVFKDAEDTLSSELTRYVETANGDDAHFVLSTIHSLEGREPAFSLTKEIVARFEAGSDIHKEAASALTSAGVLSGEFGTAEMLEERNRRLADWITDPRPTVSQFAAELIRRIDQRIASERHRARASIARRRLEYDEEPDIISDDGAE